MIRKRLQNLKKTYPITLWAMAITLAFSLLILTANYAHYPVEGFRGIVEVIVHWLASALGVFVIVALLSLNRYGFILFPIFLTASAVTAYFTWQYDVSINTALIESIVYTDTGEVSSFLSAGVIITILISLAAGVLAVIHRFKLRLKKQDLLVLSLITILSMGVFYTMNRVRYNTLKVRAPFSLYYASKQYLAERQEITTQRLMLGHNAGVEADSITVVMVIGEALRADHVQLNGYHRETMPRMGELGVYSLPHVYSPYTHTAQSLMYMLTRADSIDSSPMYGESSFIDIFKSAGFETIWLGNQNPVKTFRFFVNECHSSYINKPQLSDYSNTPRYDSDLIPHWENFLTNDAPKKLAIIHMAGNHWWYNKNYPDTFAVFQPVLTNKVISPANRERMINSYDNATLFSDYVLGEMIDQIEDDNAMLIFLADHGQSFGEEGKWMHANDTEAEKNPACFIWLSDAYKHNYPQRVKYLEQNRTKHWNTSFLFHSMLQGSSISSPYLMVEHSIFNP